MMQFHQIFKKIKLCTEINCTKGKTLAVCIPLCKLMDNALSRGGLDSYVAEGLIDGLSNRLNPYFCSIQEDFHPLDSNKGGEC